jgi:hypothetical protein
MFFGGTLEHRSKITTNHNARLERQRLCSSDGEPFFNIEPFSEPP